MMLALRRLWSLPEAPIFGVSASPVRGVPSLDGNSVHIPFAS